MPLDTHQNRPQPPFSQIVHRYSPLFHAVVHNATSRNVRVAVRELLDAVQSRHDEHGLVGAFSDVADGAGEEELPVGPHGLRQVQVALSERSSLDENVFHVRVLEQVEGLQEEEGDNKKEGLEEELEKGPKEAPEGRHKQEEAEVLRVSKNSSTKPTY